LEARIQQDRDFNTQSQQESHRKLRELKSIIQEKDFQIENLTDEVSRQNSVISGLEARIAGISSQHEHGFMPEFQQDMQRSISRPLQRQVYCC
jgi:uncharacterized protein HemX